MSTHSPSPRDGAHRTRSAQALRSLTYVLAPCSLGQVLVAVSEQGVACVLLGDSQAQLEAQLRSRFAGVACERVDIRACASSGAAAQQAAWGVLAQALEQVLALVEQPQLQARVPQRPHLHPLPTIKVALDMRGTLFQQKVWQALQTIPMGRTISYAQLAQQLGQPTAARAVAAACAANPLAVLIPCHRVVRSDGQLAGYRWGVQRKQALLAREKAAL